MTLRELRNQIDSTKAIKTLPTVKALREMKPKVAAKRETSDSSVTVYRNGLAVYSENGYETVIRVDEMKDYVYHFASEGCVVNETDLLDMDFAIPLMMIGSDQVKWNRDSYRVQKESPYTEKEDSNYEDVFGDVANKVEQEILITEFIKSLTPFQEQVFRLYYLRGETEQDIADELGSTQQAVHKAKNIAAIKLEKFLINF